jgi:hydroxyacylglutathione hydrolase
MKRLFVFSLIALSLVWTQHAACTRVEASNSPSFEFKGASHRIVNTYTFPGFRMIQFTLPALSVYSYMLISEGEALMVDPVRDISFYLETAKKEGVNIKGVYLSHSHADFVAGHTEMAKALKCPIYQSHKSGVQYPIKAVDETSIVRLGKATLKFIDTPGHTPDGMCCAVYSEDQPSQPKLLFTGDVLFVGSVGRPDLMGGTVSAAWLAAAMYHSWRNKLSKIPDNVMVLPAHGAGSLCGTKLSGEPNSTIGRERKTNPYLKLDNKSAFVAAVLQGLPEAPQYFQHDARMNREGPPPVNWNAPIPAEIKPSLSLSDPRQYTVVDIREASAYGMGHIRNALNISHMGRLEHWVGTMVPWKAKLVLVGSTKEWKEAVFRLHRVGYKADVISMESWEKARLPIAVSPPIPPGELHRLMRQGTAPLIVDVRKPSEWETLRIVTVLNLPLNSLPNLSGLLNPREQLVVYCRTGYRSSIAIGMLERKGFKKATSVLGGIKAWMEDGLPVAERGKRDAVQATSKE